jgi:hypothetical protein
LDDFESGPVPSYLAGAKRRPGCSVNRTLPDSVELRKVDLVSGLFLSEADNQKVKMKEAAH